MARGRYSSTPVLDGRTYASFRFPRKRLGDPGLLAGVQTVDHTVVRGERLDHLAARYYNDEELWWVIALANGISYPLGLLPGQVLRVPVDPRDVIDRVLGP